MEPVWYIVNIEGVICRDDRYLVVVRSEQEPHAPGTLSFPGGKVEGILNQPDVLEQTLRREVMEETGVELAPELVYLESKAFGADDGDPVVDIVFLGRYAAGQAHAADLAEVAAVEWLTADEIFQHPKAPVWTKNSLAKAEARRIALGWR